MHKKTKKLLKFLVKLLISFALIFFVIHEIDISKVMELVKTANIKFIFLAYLCIFFAQMLGGLRMRNNFNSEGLKFTRIYAIGFYYIGMMFNLVLPGGIGGDGYKAYYFQKRYRFPWRRSVLIVLRGRANGLAFMCLFLFLLLYINHEYFTFEYAEELFLGASLLIFPVYSLCSKYLLKETISMQISGMQYSFFSQILFILGIIGILQALGNEENTMRYIIVFLVANIVSVIPISFGGLGLRELTFLKASVFMALSSDLGVAVSFIFYLLYSVVALTGFIPYLMLAKLDKNQLLKMRKYKFSQKFMPHEHDVEATASAVVKN
jgi:uncharacterized membrane protein YbhN (UPF0104 family)